MTVRLRLSWRVQKSLAIVNTDVGIINVVKGRKRWFWYIEQNDGFEANGTGKTRIECQIAAESVWANLRETK